VTPTQDITSRMSGYTESHDVAPGRGSHLVEIVGLAAVLAGDAVAFYQLAAVAMQYAGDRVVWMLVVALSAAATLSMHLAGTAARARKVEDSYPGRLWSGFLLAAWVLLGAGSFWFRLASAPGSGATADGGLGAPVDTGSATHLPMAFLLLLLYLVGGLTAFGIGYRMHNPARAAYFRARRAERRARLTYRWTLWWRDRAPEVAPAPRLPGDAVLERIEPRPGLAAVPAPVDAALVDPALVDPAPVDPAPVDPALADAASAASAAQPVIDELAARRQLVLEQAEELKQRARHRLAVALAEPARTSGVFASPTAHSLTDRTHS
jgi:hypothetical protein